MPIPPEFTNFDVANAAVRVWLFKKYGGAGGVAPTFAGRWIETTPELDSALKDALIAERARIQEVHEYGLLAQNNEASALTIDALETHAGLISDATDNPLPQRAATTLQHLQNTHFYVVRLTAGGATMLAVRRTDSGWKTKKRRGVIDVVFQNQALDVDDSPAFVISRHVDFFVVGGRILVTNKANFESVLSYRQAHEDDFVQLQAEPEFTAIFTDIGPLLAFVGTNKIQLRRVCAIRQKGHYKSADFLERLRAADDQFTIQFDDQGKIVPTPETCRDIITALLDHRLMSLLTANIYDVPDATKIN